MSDPIPYQVRFDLQQTAVCPVCAKFQQLHKAASALADVDAVPASTYFGLVGSLRPYREAHMRRRHPALAAYNARTEEVRRQALDMPT